MSGWHANTKSVKSYGKRGTRVVKVLVDLDSPIKDRAHAPALSHSAHVSSSPGKVLFVRSATSTSSSAPAKGTSSAHPPPARKDVLQDKNGRGDGAVKDGGAKKQAGDVCKGGKPAKVVLTISDDDDDDQENVGIKLSKLKPSASSKSSSTFRSSSSSDEVIANPRRRAGRKLNGLSVSPSPPPSSPPVTRNPTSRLSAVPSSSSISSRSSRSRSNTPALSVTDSSPPRPTRASRSTRRPVVPDSPPSSSCPSPVAVAVADADARPTTRSVSPAPSPPSGSLADLLLACSQTSAPLQFTNFLASPHLRSGSSSAAPIITKVGEATYSEVFALSAGEAKEGERRDDWVMKVIPLMSDEKALEIALEGLTLGAGKEAVAEDAEQDEEEGEPEPVWSDPRDVAKEVRLGRLVGDMDGFCDLLGAFVVEGSYPAQLLEQWDAFAEASPEKTENAHPSVFPSTQLYAVLLLPYGGKDLESYTFSKSRPWAEAAGIFWSVAQSLAAAEEQLHFEHRDLHLGQILVQPSSTSTILSHSGPFDEGVGVETTIIDFGLSRVDAPEGSVTPIWWTPLDEEIFEGEGKQWDVYRSMRTHIASSSWEAYHPQTNALWLGFIASSLLTALPRKPTKAKGQVGERERDAYAALVETRKWLTGGGDGEEGAAGLVQWGRERGWCA